MALVQSRSEITERKSSTQREEKAISQKIQNARGTLTMLVHWPSLEFRTNRPLSAQRQMNTLEHFTIDLSPISIVKRSKEKRRLGKCSLPGAVDIR